MSPWKFWAITRHDGRVASPGRPWCGCHAMTGLILSSKYQKQRRRLAKEHKAAFARNPTGSNQVWQLEFSE